MPITLFICDQYTSIKIVLHVIMHSNMKWFYLTDSKSVAEHISDNYSNIFFDNCYAYVLDHIINTSLSTNVTSNLRQHFPVAN